MASLRTLYILLSLAFGHDFTCERPLSQAFCLYDSWIMLIIGRYNVNIAWHVLHGLWANVYFVSFSIGRSRCSCKVFIFPDIFGLPLKFEMRNLNSHRGIDVRLTTVFLSPLKSEIRILNIRCGVASMKRFAKTAPVFHFLSSARSNEVRNNSELDYLVSRYFCKMCNEYLFRVCSRLWIACWGQISLHISAVYIWVWFVLKVDEYHRWWVTLHRFKLSRQSGLFMKGNDWNSEK